MKTEITKDRVLEAASKCPTAKETLKVLFPEFFEEVYKIGDFFNDGNENYILAQIDFSKCALVSLNDGNRLVDPATVESVVRITQSEFNQFIGRRPLTKVKLSINQFP